VLHGVVVVVSVFVARWYLVCCRRQLDNIFILEYRQIVQAIRVGFWGQPPIHAAVGGSLNGVSKTYEVQTGEYRECPPPAKPIALLRLSTYKYRAG
jgi:hypothetical protein